MKSEADRLRNEIANLEMEITAKKTRLRYLETSCTHQWGETVQGYETYYETVTNYNDIQRHGVHMDYGTKRVECQRQKWTRTCKCCGKVESTTSTTPVVTQKPAF